MDLLSIGEFARRSRLSPKALRLYDELVSYRRRASMTTPGIATTRRPSSTTRG